MQVSQPIQLRLVAVTVILEVAEELMRLKPKLLWVFFCVLVVITNQF